MFGCLELLNNMAGFVSSDIVVAKGVVMHPRAHHGQRRAIFFPLFIKRCAIVHAENERVLCMQNGAASQLCSAPRELVRKIGFKDGLLKYALLTLPLPSGQLHFASGFPNNATGMC